MHCMHSIPIANQDKLFVLLQGESAYIKIFTPEKE